MEFLSDTYIVFFVVIAIGIAIGKIKIKGISLDISAIIFVALVFGHFGIKMPAIFQKIGLIFFIYSIGIQAGPGFFMAFKSHGIVLLKLSLLVMTTGGVTAWILASFFNIEPELAVGLFTGALTSTPGLAAATEITDSSLASIGYGIAYPIGVIGVIIFVRIAPFLFNIDLKKENDDYKQKVNQDHPKLINRNFIVKNPNIFNKTLGELDIRKMTGTNISRVLHNEKASTPNSFTVLYENDIIKAVGTVGNLKKIKLLIGEETNISIKLNKTYVVRNVLVSNQKIVNKTLGETGLLSRYNSTATTIRRSGIDITPNANTKLHFGDKVMIASNENDIKQVCKLFGDNRKKINELNFLPISVGILVGVLLGKFSFPVAGIDLKLGLTGGVLISAIVLSRIGKTGNILWNISGDTNMLLRKIGLLFFLTTVGTNAGEHFLSIIKENGILILGIGMAITILPLLLSTLVGKYIFKLNFLTLLGGLTGSMTSTPALSAVEPMTDTNAPQDAYATIYPFAVVLIIIFSQILAVVM
jgi:putative transport protein